MNFRKLSRRLLWLVLFNFCLICAAFAQNKLTPAQELAQKIAAAKSEIERNALLEQNKDLQTIDLRKALLAEALRFRVEGSYDKALATDKFVWQFAERIDDKAGVAAAINNVGVDYQEIGQFKTAIEYFNQSLERKIALKDQIGIAASTNNIGLGYSYMGEYARAQEFLLKALKMLEDAKRVDLMPNPLNNLGIVQRRLGNYAQAQSYYEQSNLRCKNQSRNSARRPAARAASRRGKRGRIVSRFIRCESKSDIRQKRSARRPRQNRIRRFQNCAVCRAQCFNDANPLYSYLLLSPNPATGDDGLLEARELMNLNLSADLVVLSACETARGRVSAGEGLTGMTWALFVAGVPTTVASQWKVSSAGTSEIMLDFHRNLLRTGNFDKAASLRQAELNFLRNGAFQHPFYWAGFVLVGSN